MTGGGGADVQSGRGKRRRTLATSRLTQFILLSNLAALAILVSGMLVLSEMRRGLIDARIDSLRTQGELIANVIEEAATEGSPRPRLLAEDARTILKRLYVPEGVRARLYNAESVLVADSRLLGEQVVVRDLPPIGSQEARAADPGTDRTGVLDEVAIALVGQPVWGERTSEDGERIVSVSLPIQRVQAVLGVLTLEAGGVDAIIEAEQRALAPFIAVAVIVSIVSSVLLTFFIAEPLRKLAAAADRVREAGPRAARIPSFSHRRDEIGDLAIAFSAMTDALADRIDAIERFAADVAHELKNPLTSIRSALETLPLAKTPEQTEKLLGVMRHDVVRLDRLITDISNASRMDAELARRRSSPIDLSELVRRVSALYGDAGQAGPRLVLEGSWESAPVVALDGPLGQVFRNLIDNARTFSPPEGVVRITMSRHSAPSEPPRARVTVEDEGPGVPPENLERVFERFYTERPKGAAFGSHSGLGLSIARQIVEAHGGRIWAENRTGADGMIVGARFSVELPIQTGG